MDANRALRALALELFNGSARLRDTEYRHGNARAALADAEPADLVFASYVIGEIGEAERPRSPNDVGKDARHSAGRRARDARGLCEDHRAARPPDRIGRPCRGPLPA